MAIAVEWLTANISTNFVKRFKSVLKKNMATARNFMVTGNMKVYGT